jgi:hypothetical protein
VDRQRKSQYCISNPNVKELIIQYLADRADMGHEILYIAQPDAFTPCECRECYSLYGTGDDWDEKLWLFHRDIAGRIQHERPGVKFLILSYQVTIHPPKSFDKFPENTMVHITHTYREALDEWSGSGVEVPGGFVLVPRMFGSHFYTNFLPKMTPFWLEKRVRSFYETDLEVVGLKPMASIDCYGLEGPAYYVFGRMFDDPPNNTAEGLLEEFYTAAFGEAADPMRRFYSILHEHYRFNSDWLAGRAPTQWTVVINGPKPVGVDDPLDWVGSTYARLFGSRGMKQRNTDPGQTLNMIYRPDMILDMERELAQAEALAAADKVKKRLELVRMEFDYMRLVPSINHLYNAWSIHPDDTALARLLEAIDSLNALLDSYYDQKGKMRTIPGWPEILPFRATGRNALGLRTDRHWGRKKEYMENPFAWDTRAMRDSMPHKHPL